MHSPWRCGRRQLRRRRRLVLLAGASRQGWLPAARGRAARRRWGRRGRSACCVTVRGAEWRWGGRWRRGGYAIIRDACASFAGQARVSRSWRRTRLSTDKKYYPVSSSLLGDERCAALCASLRDCGRDPFFQSIRAVKAWLDNPAALAAQNCRTTPGWLQQVLLQHVLEVVKTECGSLATRLTFRSITLPRSGSA